jgi:hypothetical protein
VHWRLEEGFRGVGIDRYILTKLGSECLLDSLVDILN